MMHSTDLERVYCPYCGESIELQVDLSVDYQEYIEDCSVCCRPITVNVTVTEAGAELQVRNENE